MPTPNSATRNSAHPLWWPSTCAAWAWRSGPVLREPGWSASCAGAGPVRLWRCAPTWMPCRSRSRRDCPSPPRPGARIWAEQGDVMHACGHDGHVAILMGVAQILANLRDRLPGTVVFYFKPAEEGPSDFAPDGQNSWGAKLMLQEGAPVGRCSGWPDCLPPGSHACQLR